MRRTESADNTEIWLSRGQVGKKSSHYAAHNCRGTWRSVSLTFNAAIAKAANSIASFELLGPLLAAEKTGIGGGT
jgi:hypothetical protein